jgi:membrane protease YdiL (CAAX protease family)
MVAMVLTGLILHEDTPRSQAEIMAMVSSDVVWTVVAGLAALSLATWVYRLNGLGFQAPEWRSVARLIWFPVLALLPFCAIALAVGLPPPRAMLFLALNTALIALSEEWMFRGILFQALRSRLNLWPAVLLTSSLFGAVHLLNVLVFGDLALAAAQAVAAAMTGLLLVALVIRTGSIWPSIVYHMVWNFSILLVAYETSKYLQADGPAPLTSYLMPMLIVLPNFLFALFLLRKVAAAQKSA